MKKLLALTLVLMLSLTLFAACGEDDKLVVGITEYKPMDYKDESEDIGNCMGCFTICLL